MAISFELGIVPPGNLTNSFGGLCSGAFGCGPAA
jgi:hypothetical protein